MVGVDASAGVPVGSGIGSGVDSTVGPAVASLVGAIPGVGVTAAPGSAVGLGKGVSLGEAVGVAVTDSSDTAARSTAGPPATVTVFVCALNAEPSARTACSPSAAHQGTGIRRFPLPVLLVTTVPTCTQVPSRRHRTRTISPLANPLSEMSICSVLSAGSGLTLIRGTTSNASETTSTPCSNRTWFPAPPGVAGTRTRPLAVPAASVRTVSNSIRVPLVRRHFTSTSLSGAKPLSVKPTHEFTVPRVIVNIAAGVPKGVVGDGCGDSVAVAVGTGVDDAVAVTLAATVDVRLGVAVDVTTVSVAVGSTVAVASGDGTAVDVAVVTSVAVEVGVPLSVGSGVDDGAGLGVVVEVAVALGVAVLV